MSFEPVIGLEIHTQLQTETKLFCGCSTRFGAPPNAHTCPVCLGMPGALPVLNRRAVELAIKAALALGCTVHPTSIFARKNYFYPDLPKGYQISQYDRPLATEGALEFETGGESRRIGIIRVHLEEDAGKSLHEGLPDSDRVTSLDFNRSGVPLIEIVSHPDVRSASEAAEYFSRMRAILVAAGVTDGNMEEGSLRCDANVSVRRPGEGFGVKTEIKNLNSFRHVQRALEYEIDRQVAVLQSDGAVEHETRLWDVGAGRTSSMRSKEEAHDYRYFPEPDLPPLQIQAVAIDELKRSLPELPDARRRRFMDGAIRQASALGYHVHVLDRATSGEAREAGNEFATAALALKAPKRACVIAAGETTVHVRGSGRGGRNQEFALGALPAIDGVHQSTLVLASAGTDGIDGPTDAAGAIVDTTTTRRAELRGIRAAVALNDNGAYDFFAPLGDLIIWGPTGTNVGDLHGDFTRQTVSRRRHRAARRFRRRLRLWPIGARRVGGHGQRRQAAT